MTLAEMIFSCKSFQFGFLCKYISCTNSPSKKILSPTERQDVSELTLDCLSALMNTTRKTEIVKERLTQRICCKEIYDGNY